MLRPERIPPPPPANMFCNKKVLFNKLGRPLKKIPPPPPPPKKKKKNQTLRGWLSLRNVSENIAPKSIIGSSSCFKHLKK